MLGGFGVLTAAVSATNCVMSWNCSEGLNRRSNPIVVDGFELMLLPHREPATWPGKTSTPSPSSSNRCSDR